MKEDPLIQSTDPARWARELFETFDIRCEDGPVFDEGTAIGWFANAIAAGRRASEDDLPIYEHFAAWAEFGRRQGWCSSVACATHDGVPMTEAEELEAEEGYDPCLPVLRLW